MASTNEVFGQIGAAKIFAGGVSNALNMQTDVNESKIQDLEQQLAETTDEKEKKHLQKKIKRLKKSNKATSKIAKIAQGATDFLLKIAEFCDIGKKAMINWLANYIVYIVPALEVAVKMLLLSNIKKMISCSLDARIPDKWRTEGVLINEIEIDPRHTLYSSPYSAWGRYNYFGVYADDNDMIGVPLFTLSKAEDMNAFIWFTKNCAKFVNPICVNDRIDGTRKLSDYFNVASDATLYNTHTMMGKEGFKYLPGCAFKQTPDSNTIFLVLWAEEEGGVTTYGIYPVTNTWTTVNWFKNRGNSAKEKPIFSLEYSNDYNKTAKLPKNNFRFKILPKPFSMAGGFVTDLGNDINVLADAVENPVVEYIGGSDVQGVTHSTLSNLKWPGIASLVPHVARFNDRGQYDKRGKYSIYEDKFTVRLVASADKKITTYELLPKSATSTQERTTVKYLLFDSKNKNFYLSTTPSDPTVNNGHGTPLTPNEASSVLIECYFGKTVYEFNYDYVMSLKLFDAKVIAANIVNGLLNIDIPNPFKKKKSSNGNDNTISNRDQAYIDNYVDKLVEKIIETEDDEFTDCFYTFSNQEYTDLEEAVNQKIINGTIAANELESDNNITAVYDILNAYKADSSLEEQLEVITRTITKASEIMDGGSNSSNSNNSDSSNSITYTSNSNNNDSAASFITKAVKILMASIVNAILSPKVLMLIQINQKLMNNDPLALNKNYSFTVKDVLNGVKGILSSIIKEIIASIQKELLRIILARINEIMSAYLKQLALEFAKKWVDLLKQLLACFKFKKSRLKGNSNDRNNNDLMDAINGAIGQVDYADIDVLADEIMPNTKNC